MLVSEKPGFVYVMANRRNGTIYIGSTSNLIQRAYQHREGLIDGFTNEHGCKLLVWYEAGASIEGARMRELQMKKWRRAWKLREIEGMNPDWRDLIGISSEVSRLWAPAFAGEQGLNRFSTLLCPRERRGQSREGRNWSEAQPLTASRYTAAAPP